MNNGRLRGSIDDHIRMFAPERLGDVAVPANRQISRHGINRRRDWDLAPLDRHALGIHKSGLVIDDVDFRKGLRTECSALAAIPFLEDAAHQTFFRRDIQLQQALLSAILLDGPAPAIFQTEIGMTE